MMDLKNYCERAYQVATYNGFYREYKSPQHYICLIISELMEAVQAHRHNKFINIGPNDVVDYLEKVKDDDDFYRLYDYLIHNTYEDELADVCIRIFSFARYMGFTLQTVGDEVLVTLGIFNRENPEFTELILQIVDILRNYPPAASLDYALSATVLLPIRYETRLDRIIPLKLRYNKLRGYLHGAVY